MAYKKYAKKFKKGFRKHVTMNNAQKALNIALATKRLLNVEHKAWLLANSTTVNTTGSVTNVFGLSQGSAWNNRTGDSVKINSITAKFRLTSHASSTNTTVRIILLRGKFERATSPTIATTLETSSVIAPKNHDQRFATKFLYDKTFNLPYGTHLMVQTPKIRLNKIKDPHVEFTTGGSTVENGGIYMLLLSTEATNTPTVQYEIDTRYIDN